MVELFLMACCARYHNMACKFSAGGVWVKINDKQNYLFASMGGTIFINN